MVWEMSYKVIFDKIAKTDIDAIKKSGDKSSLKKLNKILDELGIHPKTGTGVRLQTKLDFC